MQLQLLRSLLADTSANHMARSHLVRISYSITLLAIVSCTYVSTNQEYYMFTLDSKCTKKAFCNCWGFLFLFIKVLIPTRNECMSPLEGVEEALSALLQEKDKYPHMLLVLGWWNLVLFEPSFIFKDKAFTNFSHIYLSYTSKNWNFCQCIGLSWKTRFKQN